MSKQESIARYSIIVNRLQKRASSFEELSRVLEKESDLQSYNFTVSKRTFQRDINDIRSIFGFDIKYNRSNNTYFIDSSFEQSEAEERMLEAFNMLNAINAKNNLSQFMHFERRKPKGTENIFGLLHAIKNKLVVTFTYEKFYEDEIWDREAEPYALKEFRGRWYVLAKDNGKIKSFALDRLTNLEITTKKIRHPEQYNVEETYRNCFGIIAPNSDFPHEVILSFSSFQGKYIKTMPLHETQEIIVDDEDELRIKLKLFITDDFIMELLSYGSFLKVLQPKELISEIKKLLSDAIKKYKK